MKGFSLKVICASFLAVTVTVMVAFCCCGLKVQIVSAKSCSKCSKDTVNHQADSKSHECCLSKLVPVDLSPAFAVMPSIEKAASFLYHTVEFALLPLKAKFNLAYINGPPRVMADVPAYIQFHSLRI